MKKENSTVRSNSADGKSLKSRSETKTGEKDVGKNAMEETFDSQCTEDGMSLALMTIQELHMDGDTSPRGTLESPSSPRATIASRTDSVVREAPE